MTTTPPPGRPRDGRAVVVYTACRFGLLAGCLALGWLAGLRGGLLLLAALLVSGVLSWFVLARQRLAMGAAVDHVVGRVRARMHARTEAEDAYVDALLGSSDGPPRGR